MEQEPAADAPAATPTIAPPPLTPINTLKAGAASQKSVLPPKLQRIPRPDDAQPPPRLTPRPPAVPQPETRGLVGGVTTWFPHSATVRVGGGAQPQSGAARPPRPQFLEIVGSKKYLIIPKHSVLSVSPTIAATAAAGRPEEGGGTPVAGDGRGPSAPDSARLGPESGELKVEAKSPTPESHGDGVDLRSEEGQSDGKAGDENE